MLWAAVDAPTVYGTLYRSANGQWAIHLHQVGFGHTCAKLYAVDGNGHERLVAERCGRDALEQAQEAAK